MENAWICLEYHDFDSKLTDCLTEYLTGYNCYVVVFKGEITGNRIKHPTCSSPLLAATEILSPNYMP